MDINRKVMYVIFVLLYTTVRVACDRHIPVSVTSGIYWKRHEQAVMYEASVPLMYKSKLPEVDMAQLSLPEVNGFCEGRLNDPKCILFNWIFQADKLVGKRVKWLNSSLSLEETEQPNSKVNYRGKRSIHFLGDAAHWCCGVITKRQLKL